MYSYLKMWRTDKIPRVLPQDNTNMPLATDNAINRRNTVSTIMDCPHSMRGFIGENRCGRSTKQNTNGIIILLLHCHCRVSLSLTPPRRIVSNDIRSAAPGQQRCVDRGGGSTIIDILLYYQHNALPQRFL